MYIANINKASVDATNMPILKHLFNIILDETLKYMNVNICEARTDFLLISLTVYSKFIAGNDRYWCFS